MKAIDIDNILTETLKSNEQPSGDLMAKVKTGAAREPISRKSKNSKRFIRILIAAVLCLVTGGTVFAVSNNYFQFLSRVDEVDMGTWQLISIPEEQYQSEFGRNAGYLYEYYAPDRIKKVDSETAYLLRQQMADMVFAANGQPFDIFSPASDSDGFYANAGDNVLYDEFGKEIAEIYYNTMESYDGLLVFVHIMTIEEEEAMRSADSDYITYTNDYAQAAQILGLEFRLPGIYTEGLDAPEFRASALMPIQLQDENYELYDSYFNSEVRIWFNGDPGISYFVEKKHSEDSYVHQWYLVDSIIEEGMISDTTVFKIINDDMIRYTWEHEGLIYMLFNFFDVPNQFTDEQFSEIIYSMIS